MLIFLIQSKDFAQKFDMVKFMLRLFYFSLISGTLSLRLTLTDSNNAFCSQITLIKMFHKSNQNQIFIILTVLRRSV